MAVVDNVSQLHCSRMPRSFNFVSCWRIANGSRAEICQNKWFLCSMEYRSFFLVVRLAGRRDINFYYHFPSRTVAQLDYSNRKFWRAETQRTAWPTCRERISGMCEWSPCARGIYWKWLPWFLLDVTKITLSAFANRRISLRQFAK